MRQSINVALKAGNLEMKIVAVVAIVASSLLGTGLFACTNDTSSTTSQTAATSFLATPAVQKSEARQTQSSTDRIKVLTTISVFADIIHQVGQDRVRVKNIVPAGGDPHTFQPTPQDVRDIAESSIAFVNGMGLEGPIEKLIRASGKPDLPVIILSEGLSPLQEQEARADEQYGGEHSAGNPHLWLDVRMAMLYVQRIQQELARIDPAGKADYESNASRYLAELAELDAWIEQQIGTVPREKRKLVTFHDAFPYYAKRYGLDLIGVVVRSPGREPSAREVAELVDTLRREKVRTVFIEPQLNARVLEVAAKEAGVKLAILYSDSTDSRITSYSAMMRYNTEQIVDGLR